MVPRLRTCGSPTEPGTAASPGIAAVINAITDALGTEQVSMPATPNMVWHTLQRTQTARQAAAE